MKALKNIFVTLFISVFVATTAVAAEPDSIIVQFGGKSKMVIHAKDKEGIVKIQNYDLNKILKDMTAQLDSNNKDTYIILNEKNGEKYRKDTVFVFKTSVDTVAKHNGDVTVSFKDGKVVIVDKDGRRRSITIGGSGTKGQDGKNGNAKTGSKSDNPADTDKADSKDSKDREYENGKNEDNESNDDDDDIEIQIPRKDRGIKSPRKGFNMNIGVNVYGQNDAMKYNTADYDLRAGASRYFAMGWTRSAILSKGKSARAFLDFTLDFSWYNMMFDGNNTAQKNATGNVTFPELMADGKPIALEKSKMVAPFVNLSLMPTIAFSGSSITYISAGAYAGYRIGGYTKTKMAGSNNKDHIKSNLGLNDFRYGFGAEIGLKSLPDLFINYDMNELFQANKGPAVRMLSFGVKL